jgi:hypothetical protein
MDAETKAVNNLGQKFLRVGEMIIDYPGKVLTNIALF